MSKIEEYSASSGTPKIGKAPNKYLEIEVDGWIYVFDVGDKIEWYERRPPVSGSPGRQQVEIYVFDATLKKRISFVVLTYVTSGPPQYRMRWGLDAMNWTGETEAWSDVPKQLVAVGMGMSATEVFPSFQERLDEAAEALAFGFDPKDGTVIGDYLVGPPKPKPKIPMPIVPKPMPLPAPPIVLPKSKGSSLGKTPGIYPGLGKGGQGPDSGGWVPGVFGKLGFGGVGGGGGGGPSSGGYKPGVGSGDGGGGGRDGGAGPAYADRPGDLGGGGGGGATPGSGSGATGSGSGATPGSGSGATPGSGSRAGGTTQENEDRSTARRPKLRTASGGYSGKEPIPADEEYPNPMDGPAGLTGNPLVDSFGIRILRMEAGILSPHLGPVRALHPDEESGGPGVTDVSGVLAYDPLAPYAEIYEGRGPRGARGAAGSVGASPYIEALYPDTGGDGAGGETVHMVDTFMADHPLAPGAGGDPHARVGGVDSVVGSLGGVGRTARVGRK